MTRHPRFRHLAAAAAALVLMTPAGADAQMSTDSTIPPPDPVLARSDELHAAGDAAGSLGVLREALRDTSTVELLWRAARENVHLGILDAALERDESAGRWFTAAEAWADRTIVADSSDARGWSWKAIAIGRRSELVGTLERVELANRIKETAEAALARDPDDSGALHVLGAWHAEILRLSAIERFTARRILGGRTFDAATWEIAETSLRRATERSPGEVVHRLEYARVLDDLDRRAEALEQLRAAVDLVPRHPADEVYLNQARALLAEWGG